MKSPVEVKRSFCAGSAGPAGLAHGELHVVTVTGDVAGWEESAIVRRALCRLLDDPDPPLTYDGYGRLMLDGDPVGTAVSAADRLVLAVAPGAAAAASELALSAARFTAWSLLTPHEQRLLEMTPKAARNRLMAGLWVRKEAALRLSGHGGLVLAAQVEAVVDRPGGLVAVPASDLGHLPFTACVYDVATTSGYVAAVATQTPVSEVFHTAVTL